MQSSARDAYLTTQVMTATPQKLQLMLIDGAMRCGQKAKQAWQDNDLEAASEALVHAQEVVSELLASTAAADSDVSRRLAGIYLFLFRTLSEAHLQQDEEKLDDVLRVLAVERETWRQVCEKFGSTVEGDSARQNTRGIDATSLPLDQLPLDRAAAKNSPPIVAPLTNIPESGGISFEA